jgi:hypothetical protein
MALTKEQSDALKDFFPVQAHEFLNGNTYISEEAITNRLDDVDPSWTMELMSEYTRDKQCIAVMRLTVCGVSRDGVGMQPTKIMKKDGTEMDGTEPEKSAATDALKRAARLFGIGRYILEMGRAVSDHRTLADWLAKRRSINTNTGEIQIVQNAAQSHQEGATSVLQPAVGDFESTFPSNAKTGAERLGTPNGQRIGQEPAKGIEVIAVRATVKNTKNNKPFLLLESDSGQKVSLFSRDPLRNAGYECEDWTEMDKTYVIDPPAAVTAKQDGKFLNFESLIKADSAIVPF